jgi:hypothetical protein
MEMVGGKQRGRETGDSRSNEEAGYFSTAPERDASA